ncbi:MAG: BTAD domain-containing putative transcriptional regulator, partial [Anaerolineae bacterium]
MNDLQSTMADTVRAHLLGSLQILHGDATGDHLAGDPLPLPASTAARSLLAYLLLHRERPHPRSVLAGIWWPDVPENRARRALSQALWHIRRALPDTVAADGDAIRIPPEVPLWVDVAAFRALLEPHLSDVWSEHGEMSRRYADPEQRQTVLDDLRQAVQLYRGDLLEGFYDDWVMLERERLRELYLQALESLSHLESAAGRYEAALESALALAQADPLREAAHRDLMHLYARLGRPEAALQQFAVCRQILRDELDLEPGPETAALAQQIITRRGQRPADYPSGPVTLDSLRQFPIPLVGREAERAQLLSFAEHVFQGERHVVLVAGEAGVGKTCLLETVAGEIQRRGVQVLWGNCQEQAATLPYGPLVEALATGLSAGHADQLVGLVESIWLQVLSPLLPPLAAALSDHAPRIAISPIDERARLVEALAHLLSGWSQIVPIVLV